MGIEAAIEDRSVEEAEAAGFFVRKVQWPGRRGAPDRLYARADRGTVFIEWKAPDKQAESHQTREHDRMRAAGIEVHVCDSLLDFRRILGL